MISFPASLINHSHLLHQRTSKLYFFVGPNPHIPSVRSSAGLPEISPIPLKYSQNNETGTQLQIQILDSLPRIESAKRVVLVRHGQSTWNEEGRIQGSSDFSVLTTKGESQAETSRQMLLTDSFDVCFHSPLNRSKRTAEVIWDARKEEKIPEYDLREIDLYSFQGLLKHEGKTRFGEAYRQWQNDAANFVIDGHYPVRELWDRARNCWNKILSHEGKSVLVVAHNAVNQALVATALGLDSKYFRVLLQSNCGVSVLDFTPKEGGSPYVCVNRLNQTASSPIASGSSGGRKASRRIVLVCHGATDTNFEVSTPSGDEPMNMLGVIQSQKTAELLLDLKVSSIICSPQRVSLDTAATISKVQEAADCLGADCVPRYVEMKSIKELEVPCILRRLRKNSIEDSLSQPMWLNDVPDETMTHLWVQTKETWRLLLEELSNISESEKNMVVVGHSTLHIALIGHCLGLTKEQAGLFHLDDGSISVIDFPDGQTGQGIIRCVNYTAHLGRWSIPVTRPTMEDEEF